MSLGMRAFDTPRACHLPTDKSETTVMKSKTILTIAVTAAAAAVLGSAAFSAQDDGLQVPGGLAFSEFAGYENWGVIAAHHTGDLVKVITGNPIAIEAFRAGIPGNGQ